VQTLAVQRLNRWRHMQRDPQTNGRRPDQHDGPTRVYHALSLAWLEKSISRQQKKSYAVSKAAPVLLCKCRQTGTSSLKTLHACSRQARVSSFWATHTAAWGEVRALQRLHTRAPLSNPTAASEVQKWQQHAAARQRQETSPRQKPMCGFCGCSGGSVHPAVSAAGAL